MQTLQIALFGHVTVVHVHGQAPLKLGRGGQALLAYLLLQQCLVPREVLMDVFWGDVPPERARSSLATALWRLRQLLEPDSVRPGAYLITHNTGEVGFNWESDHWLDTAAFEKSIHALLRKPLAALGNEDIGQIDGALAHYRGELLEGVYEDWALRERERFRSLHLNCLTRLMEYHANRRNFEQCIAYGQEILRRDPLREEVHRSLMRIYLECGQRTLAMRQYINCREMLDRELGVAPLEETQSLYQQVAATAQAGPAVVSGPPADGDLAHLLRELRKVQQSIGEANRALARIQAAVNQFANVPQSGDDAVTDK